MKDGLDYFTDTQLPMIGFMIFFVLFLMILTLQVRLYSPKKCLELAHLPLNDLNGDSHE